MKILKIRDVKTPARGTQLSAGLDFFVPNDFAGVHYLAPLQMINIPSGIKAEVPPGFALIAFNKSGVALKKGLNVGACVVDEDYTGEIHLNVFNAGDEVTTVSPGEKLVQFLLVPVSYMNVVEVESEDDLFQDERFNGEQARGSGGFGSTGTK